MFLVFDTKSWINNIFRTLFGGIDSLIYSLLGWIIEGIFNLSNILANPSFVEVLYKRVYVILGIFMIFKLSFSFLKYIVNPDSMTDKEQGVSKIIARTITMIIMVIALPILFFSTNIIPGQTKPLLNAVQDALIETIPKLILGVNQSIDKDTATTAKENGKIMALTMLRSFYYPSECGDENDEGGTIECNFIEDEGITSMSSFRDSLLEGQKNSDYKFHYLWPISTVVGILLVLEMLGICVSVAIRTFKLIVLQMIAPIPVMSYIDPKSSKDGAFNSWIKTFTSTYIDIFIKLAIIYLILLLISKLLASDPNTNLFGSSIDNIDGMMSRNFARVFLIIGLIKFSKEAPKFAKDALGIKDNGGGSGLFDGLKTLGAAAGVVGGAATGLIGGIAGGVASSKANGEGGVKNTMKGLGSGLSGLARGTIRGAKGSTKGNPFKGIGDAVDAQNSINRKKIEASKAGSTWSGRMGARAEEFFHGQTAADRDKEHIEGYKTAIEDVKGFKSVLADSAAKSNATLNVGGRAANLKQFKGTLAAANAGDANAINQLKNYGFTRTVTTTTTGPNGRPMTVTATVGDLSAANAGAESFEKEYQKAYYAEVSAGRISDGDAQAVISANSVANASIASLELSDPTTGTRINSVDAANSGMVIGLATSGSNAIKSNSSYKSNRANADAIKKNGK